jgi:hypothetical protein
VLKSQSLLNHSTYCSIAPLSQKCKGRKLTSSWSPEYS